MIGKLNYKRLLLLAALPAFMLASCSREEMDGGQGSGSDTQDGVIRFEIGFASQTDVQTRVATDTDFNSTWENGDEIGIFAVEHGTKLAVSGNFIHNVKLTYTGGKWAGPAYWPTLTSGISKLDFYAYYPYDDAATDPMSIAFNVHTDQSATTGVKSNYNLSDLLMAKNDNSGNGYGKGETVELSFTHALAMVQVDVSKSMIGDYPADMLNVWLNGCTTGGVLNLSTQSTTPPTNPAHPVMIKMYPCPKDGDDAPGIYAYRALVPVQTIAAGTALFSFGYDGGTLLRSKPLVESLSLVQSKAETFDMTFPFTSATAHVSSNVRLDGLFKDDKLKTITHLKVMGEMTAADFTTIKEKMTVVTRLDLGGATVEGNAIPDEALSDKTNLKEFVFPQNIKTIGDFAFADCSGFTGSLTIPEGVETIGVGAFDGCSGFTGSLTIPEGVETIGVGAFANCSGFTGSLTIPEGVETIGVGAFADCSGFTGSLTIPQGVETIGYAAFAGCSGFTGDLTIPEGVETIGVGAFNDCSGFTGSLTIPEGVETIGVGAFNGCSGFTGDLTIPEGVTTIGNNAFYGCSGFKGSLTISKGVETIGSEAFYGCSGLSGDLTIPEGVETIGVGAFDGCSGLSGRLTIPNSVTNIGGSAFADCRNITSIYCYIEDPNSTLFGRDIFNRVPDILVHVPAEAVAAYKNHTVWEQFKNNIHAITP